MASIIRPLAWDAPGGPPSPHRPDPPLTTRCQPRAALVGAALLATALLLFVPNWPLTTPAGARDASEGPVWDGTRQGSVPLPVLFADARGPAAGAAAPNFMCWAKGRAGMQDVHLVVGPAGGRDGGVGDATLMEHHGVALDGPPTLGLLSAAVKAGKGFVYMPTTILPLQDITAAVPTRCDAVFDGNTTSASADGLPLAVRRTLGGARFWSAVVRCESEAGHEGGGGGGTNPEAGVSPACLQAAASSATAAVCSWSDLDPFFLTPSLADFEASGPRTTGVWPAAVRLNPGARPTNNSSLAALGLDAQAGTVCAVRTPGVTPPPRTTLPAVSLTICVLTMARATSLRRLMASLASADFMGDRVALHISVDKATKGTKGVLGDGGGSVRGGCGATRGRFLFTQPPAPLPPPPPPPPVPPLPTDADMTGYLEVLDLVQSATWAHGPLTHDVARSHRGLVGQWVRGWDATDDAVACLVLEDDIQVAPTFYAWLKPRLQRCRGRRWRACGQALRGMGRHTPTLPSEDHPLHLPHHSRYYARDPDPQLAGISLSYQNKIVGQVEGRQLYGAVNVTDLVDGSQGAYLAQQVSSWAPVLFPRPWRAFVAWHRTASAAPGASPCLPGELTLLGWGMDGREV